MKAFVVGLLVGILVGAGGLFFLQRERSKELARARDEAVAAAGKARDSIGAASQDVRSYLDAKLEVLGLQTEQIRRETLEQGRVIRRTARVLSQRAADAAEDARMTIEIKSKLVADPELSGLAISVSTTGGVVTLSGSVASPGRVGRAMVHALETEGVREVVSTMQVSAE